MAKLIQTRRKFRYNMAYVFFIMTVITSLATSIFLRSYNQKLTMELQTKEASIRRLHNENDVIRIEIQALESQDRIFKVAEANRMSINQDNVVLVSE